MTRRRAAYLAVGALLAVAALSFTLFLRTPGGPGPVAAPVTPTSSPAPTSSPVRATEPATEGAPPVRLRIPAIAVSARVTRLGLNPDRTVEVPSDPATTGWYRLGPTPGEQGSAVILGHVDSMSGPAVFYRLRDLRRGDLVEVDAADGDTTRFRVTSVASYLNADFPAARVYGPHGKTRGLQLVTCGGAYDEQTGYQSNLVVYTRLVQDR